MKKKEILEVFERGEYMSLSLKERRAVVREVSKRYKKASKKEKGKILDEFVKLTGKANKNINNLFISYPLPDTNFC